jgi:protein phosphatase
LSRDHSVIQKLIDRGSITPEEARNDPRRHMVTQAMGKVSTANLTIGHCTGNIAPGHKLLLCSDGLTAHLDEPELTSIIKAGGDDQALVEQMMQRALDEGGNDNITIVMLTIGR